MTDPVAGSDDLLSGEKGPLADTWDWVIIGSGFGGSVSAMRLAEKGYRVLVLERGLRWDDADFPRTNWNLRRFLWAPPLRCFGIMQISILKQLMVLHFNGVGGGSLGYANVLEVPDEPLFSNPAWRHLADWRAVLAPHYETARRMLGVTTNPRFWPADETLREIAGELGRTDTFRATEVGVYFGDDPGREAGMEAAEEPDPYFDGAGPPRRPCIHCGGCMVGCRHNAKNSLPKNYLYFAEIHGARIEPNATVTGIRPLDGDDARYEVFWWPTTALLRRGSRARRTVKTRNVVVAAGTLGTNRLLLRCRDTARTLPRLSGRLGESVRTNSEALHGSISRSRDPDYSEGVAITSIFNADDETRIEPVRYPDGSSLLRFISAPLISTGDSLLWSIIQTLWQTIRNPFNVLRTHVLPGWAHRATIIMAMQTTDNRLRLKLGRSPLTLFRRDLVAMRRGEDRAPARIDLGHTVTRRFAEKTGGITAGTLGENIFRMPVTPHILGGCLFGKDADEGVCGLDCQVHNYPGLYVVDGSIVPANPGVNPSLTIAALAEYAMSKVPPCPNT